MPVVACWSLNEFTHKLSMEFRPQHIVHKLLGFLLLRAAGLVLENHIVIPTALHAEILRVQQWVAGSNLVLPLLLCLGRFLRFLSNLLRNTRLLDPVELAQKLFLLILFILFVLLIILAALLAACLALLQTTLFTALIA